MANQTHAPVASKPFALICSFQVPTTELNPDLIPSVSVVIGHYDSQEQTKHARQAIQHAALISAWIDTTQDTPDQLAARKAKIEQADRDYKTRQAQAAKAEKAHAQTFIPLVATILKQCSPPMLETPYCMTKGINSHNFLSIAATDIQRFTLPKDPSEPTKKPVTVCYGFEGVLTVAILETLDGEPVALQAFDGVPDVKGKYARWLIGKPVVMVQPLSMTA